MAVSMPYGYRAKTKPRLQQIEGIRLLEANESFGVFDEMGVGKTLQVIYAALDLIRAKKADCAVVPIKAAHDSTWYDEDDCQLLTHAPEATWYSVIGLPPKKRAAPWPMDRDFYFINYELMSRMLAKGRKYGHADVSLGKTRLLGDDAINLYKLLTTRKCIMIPDEAHAIKNPEANVTKVMHALGPLAVRRWAITGSPMAERPDDVWSLMYFLDEGKTLGRNYWTFIDTYAEFAENRDGQRWIVGYKNLDKLRKKLQGRFIRRTIDECHDLPKFVRETSKLRPTGRQKTLIRDAAQNLLDVIQPMNNRQLSNAMRSKDGDYTRAMLRLMRASCAPSLLDRSAGPGVKLKEVVDLLDQLGKRQLMVWVVHQDIGQAAKDHIRKQADPTAELINVSVPRKKRKEIIRQFKKGEIRTLIATPSILGESGTYTNCSYCYYLELSPEAKPFEQSRARFRRPGQKFSVIYHLPFVLGTMDRYNWNTVKYKMSVKKRGIDKKTKIFDKTTLTHYLEKEAYR